MHSNARSHSLMFKNDRWTVAMVVSCWAEAQCHGNRPHSAAWQRAPRLPRKISLRVPPSANTLTYIHTLTHLHPHQHTPAPPQADPSHHEALRRLDILSCSQTAKRTTAEPRGNMCAFKSVSVCDVFHYPFSGVCPCIYVCVRK